MLDQAEKMVDQAENSSRGSAADSPADFVIKLEPSWTMDVEPPGQPSAADNAPQSSSDSNSTSGCSGFLNRGHECEICSATFVLVSSFELHMVAVHGEELHVVLPVFFAPDGCEDGFYASVHVGQKRKDYSNRKIGKRKKEKHVDDDDDDDICGEEKEAKDRQHVCDVCNKAFTRSGHLKTHKLIHTGYKPFVCNICCKAFSQAAHLRRHNLIHSGEKPFVCDLCNKCFTRDGDLKTHKLTHTGLKAFVCDICNKAFAQAGHLKTHELTHTGEKPFECDICYRAFTRASHLKTHRRIHTGQEMFVCDVCSKAFTQSGLLKTHKLSHTGEKPFVCDVCSKAFTRGSHLKRHKLIHTGQKTVSCDVQSLDSGQKPPPREETLHAPSQ